MFNKKRKIDVASSGGEPPLLRILSASFDTPKARDSEYLNLMLYAHSYVL